MRNYSILQNVSGRLDDIVFTDNFEGYYYSLSAFLGSDEQEMTQK
jgi:hypothetical protein